MFISGNRRLSLFYPDKVLFLSVECDFRFQGFRSNKKRPHEGADSHSESVLHGATFFYTHCVIFNMPQNEIIFNDKGHGIPENPAGPICSVRPQDLRREPSLSSPGVRPETPHAPGAKASERGACIINRIIYCSCP